jgi:hypothetical protein
VADKRVGGQQIVEATTEDGIDGIVSEWTFVGMGYTTAGDAWLAESIAEEERLARRSAYEELQDALRWEK